jgi:hypothetical protein
VARSYGGINVKIDGDYNNKDIKRAISDLKALENNAQETQGKFSGMSKGMKVAGAAVAAAAAGMAYAVGRFAVDSIGAASDLQESQSKVTAVFKDQADEVMAWADTSATAFGQSRQQALEAAGTYGNLFQAFGLTSEAAQEMSTRMVELAADLASFNNTSIDDAIQALRSGLSGETEPLKRFGVAINDARLKSEALALGIYDGVGALNAGQKAQASYQLILKDTSLAQGDFARTSDGLANTQRILQAAVENAKAEIGTGLVNAIVDVIGVLGGADGMVGQIEETSKKLSTLTVGIGVVVRNLAILNRNFSSSTSGLLDFASANRIALRVITAGVSELAFRAAEGLYAVGQAEQEAQETTEAWADYRRAQQGVVNVTPAVVDSLNDTADAAANTARSGAAAAKALLSYAISTGQVPDAAKLGQKFVISEMLDNIGKDTSTASSRASKAADTMRIKWAEAAQGFTDAAVTIEGKAVTVSGALGKAFQERAGVFREVINTQVGLIQQAQQELDTYADSVTNAILGKIDFSQTDAEGKPLTPEQIAATIIGDIANQTKAVTAIANSGVMTQLPEQLAQKILSLPPDAAVALANYFAANPAQLEQLTTNYNALATFTETALGVPMATTFATIGDTSAVEMIANARARITKAAERFRNFVQRQLSTEITVSVRYVAVNSIPGVSGGTINVTARANGGTAFAGMPTLVGERGPEIIVPSVNSTVVRGEKTRQMMRSSGATINLTVNAGMGANGAEVGREIVDAIKRYERLSGPVFVSA